MNKIRVQCNESGKDSGKSPGHRADEHPLRFVLGGREFEVEELDDRWNSPGASYFRVRASDGNFYVLRHDEAQDQWTLDAFRLSPRNRP